MTSSNKKENKQKSTRKSKRFLLLLHWCKGATSQRFFWFRYWTSRWYFVRTWWWRWWRWWWWWLLSNGTKSRRRTFFTPFITIIIFPVLLWLFRGIALKYDVTWAMTTTRRWRNKPLICRFSSFLMSSQLVPQMMKIHDLRLGFYKISKIFEISNLLRHHLWRHHLTFSISFLLLLNFFVFVRVVLQHRCFDLMMTSLKSSRASISHRSFFPPIFLPRH